VKYEENDECAKKKQDLKTGAWEDWKDQTIEER
jgi:hypothetical protein